MDSHSGQAEVEIELLCAVVNFGHGSKAMKIAKQNGIKGGTIFLGMGTIKNRILEMLSLTDIRKEILLMLADKQTAEHAIEVIGQEMSFHKPNHGIAFSMPVTGIVGTKCYKNKAGGRLETTMYHAIFIIVDKGRAEEAVDAASAAGSRGGTIINARGSGIHETNMLFSMPIEPEKEIVMILSEKKQTDAIVDSVRKALDIESPGNGILFILDVDKTYGLFQA